MKSLTKHVVFFFFFWPTIDTTFCIPYDLGPSFPNDDSTLYLKVSLGSNQMKIDLSKVSVENIIYFGRIKQFLEKKG